MLQTTEIKKVRKGSIGQENAGLGGIQTSKEGLIKTNADPHCVVCRKSVEGDGPTCGRSKCRVFLGAVTEEISAKVFTGPDGLGWVRWLDGQIWPQEGDWWSDPGGTEKRLRLALREQRLSQPQPETGSGIV